MREGSSTYKDSSRDSIVQPASCNLQDEHVYFERKGYFAFNDAQSLHTCASPLNRSSIASNELVYTTNLKVQCILRINQQL
jgi:hypothetical protein